MTDRIAYFLFGCAIPLLGNQINQAAITYLVTGGRIYMDER